MRKLAVIAIGLTMAVAGAANAQTFVAGEITVNTTWGVAPNACPIILEEPVFVKSGATLTILPGCVVRGQPRTGPVTPGVVAGSPGALIVTRTGRINAVGSPVNPIIFTTAAVDVDGDNVADVSGGFKAPFTGAEPFLDDDPAGDPLSPLDADGFENVQLWGGVVILGNAPTNLGAAVACTAGVPGERTIEGLTIPGFPVADACYGGTDPHDNSGTLQYVSIRHGGDEIGEGNELNCLSMGGVGDGTKISFVECTNNFDDGFEWFGGTVDGDHLFAAYIGDDSFDLDQGYTGVLQFLFAVMPTFSENDGDDFGSASGDKGGEFDGDDFGEAVSNVFVRASSGADAPWPLSNPSIYNMTVIGQIGDGANGAAVPAPGSDRILDLRNGFAGRIFNSIVVNGGAADGVQVRNGDGGAPGFDAETNAANGRIAIFSSTFDDVGAATAPTNTALANGNALDTVFGALIGISGDNCYNSASAPASILVNENSAAFNPDPPSGKLAQAVGANPPIDPRPNPGLCTFGGVRPFSPGTDSSATYRGAFQAGQPLWTDGWTSFSAAGAL